MSTVVRAFTLFALAGLASGTAQAAISFGGPSNLSSAQRPSGVAIGDFTGDGRADVAVTVDTPDRVLVFPQTATGFGTPIITFLPNGGGAGTLVTADFDRDGLADLAVAEQNSGVVLILKGTGTGGFIQLASVPVGANPRGMEVADLNGDLRPDLAVANRDGASASVLLNGAAGWTSTTIPSGAEPRDVALADINSDGDVDLVVSCHDDRTLRVYGNNGAGGFTAGQVISVNAIFRPDGIALVDLNADGVPEVASVISDDVVGSFVAVHANAAGIFGAGVNFATLGANASQIITGDLDRDSRPDVVVANEDSGTISVLGGLGNRQLGPAQVFATGATPSDLAIGRLNADTMPDLAITNRDANTTSLLLNTGTPPAPTCDSVDFNGDGIQQDPTDLEAFFSVYSGGPCIPASAACADVDFNNDGIQQDPTDLEAFFSVYSGGPCF